MDPWGHLAPWLFKDTIEQEDSKKMTFKLSVWDSNKASVDIRPTIAITKAHMKASGQDSQVRATRTDAPSTVTRA